MSLGVLRVQARCLGFRDSLRYSAVVATSGVDPSLQSRVLGVSYSRYEILLKCSSLDSSGPWSVLLT